MTVRIDRPRGNVLEYQEALDKRIRVIVARAKKEGTLGPRSYWLDHDPADDAEWDVRTRLFESEQGIL